MKNASISEKASASNVWASGDMLAVRPDWQEKFLGWWYAFTAVPETQANASFFKREAVRRVRLFSTVNFFFLLVLTIFIPACFFLPNHYIIWCDLGAISATLVALFINRQGNPLLAGIFLVIASEIALTAGILTTWPMDEPSIQLYDLYLIIDLLAVSVIPAWSIFVLAICNSLFICLDLMYQPQLLGLRLDLHAQFLPMLVRPVGLEIMVAGVAYLWVRSANNAVKRADKAEMIAKLEHTIAEERASAEQARRHLEESIERLVKLHTEAMNAQTIAKIPYPQEAKMLWPLVGVLNSLWVRLQHANQTEYELLHLKQVIAMYTEQLHQAMLAPPQPIPVYQTRTDLDTLMLAARNVQYASYGR